MKLVPFQMERWQSTWEHEVEFNLSESGVEPLPLRELLREDGAVDRFLDHPLAYSQGNGTPELRSSIASLYPGATPDHVLVTNGSSEACLLALWHLVDPGDEIVLMLPNYMEGWGLVQMFGGKVRPLWLREELGWQFALDDLGSLVNRRTKAIVTCNPNNPTGAVMRDSQRKAILDAARDAGAWLLSDEVYIGAEREGPRTESLWDGCGKTLVLNGLSKAYALPGLRIGWLVGPPETIE
ncbi:MAG TPA: aminotransferase class I/II-fold pyridoxal phosphate-dependent enzyme, partial [Thermoplasmata archaeon]|nr:aminotransferase class I/II-fold pyridoxal phosphate-dependent enzyme [Thermoplasmata archaeon]